MPTPYSDAALRSELINDPLKMGYAAPLAVGNLWQVRGLLYAPSQTAYLPISAAQVLKWGAATGVRLSIEQASTATGPYAPGASLDITKTPMAQSIALAVVDQLRGGIGLDLTDPQIVGEMASGAAYTPGAGAVATDGMLDVLVAASVLGTPATPLKDALIGVGKTLVSRVYSLWATTGPDIDPGRIAAVLRS